MSTYKCTKNRPCGVSIAFTDTPRCGTCAALTDNQECGILREPKSHLDVGWCRSINKLETRYIELVQSKVEKILNAGDSDNVIAVNF